MKYSKLEIGYIIISVIVGFTLIVKGNGWGQPIIWLMLFSQNLKSYQFYRKYEKKEIRTKAYYYLFGVIVFGCCTLISVILNLI